MKKTWSYSIVFALALLGWSWRPVPLQETPVSLTINITHKVGNELLKLDSATYHNPLGQPFTVSKFKYYLGNFVFNSSNGAAVRVNKYFLIDEEEAASKQLSMEIPDGMYRSVEFTIGVDSLDNCSGAQSGALDAINAMYWSWNSGYIFLKLEGTSAASKGPGHFFEYHVGGYKQPANCIRQVWLDLDNARLTGHSKNIDIAANVLELLKEPVTIDFGNLHAVTDHHNATMMADNYKDMFSLDHDSRNN